MSMLSRNINSNMGSSSFYELKKQASFFFKEKIKSARLVLTDVTPAELLTEEATNGNPWSPDARTMGSISRSAFELEDYWRIVEILHKRFSKFEKKNWRASHNSLIVLEHLLTHGPESVADEFQCDKNVIKQMGWFQYIDEKGFNWGLSVRKKSERVLKLLEKGPVLKEERDKARKLTRGIQGFGSFCHRSSEKGILQETSLGTKIGRCNSQFSCYVDEENRLPKSTEKWQKPQKPENSSSLVGINTDRDLEKPETKENKTPDKEEELHIWTSAVETNPLIDVRNDDSRTEFFTEEDHPFNETETLSTASLLPARNGIMQGC